MPRPLKPVSAFIGFGPNSTFGLVRQICSDSGSTKESKYVIQTDGKDIRALVVAKQPGCDPKQPETKIAIHKERLRREKLLMNMQKTVINQSMSGFVRVCCKKDTVWTLWVQERPDG